jgi:ComF family protein
VECDWVVPVPLHWKRHYSRGFNQSDLLGVALGKRFGKKCLGALKRIRDTPTQVGMTSQANRLENVKGAFKLAVKPCRLEGKKILLVDDVMTTGATLREAARELMKAKPDRISAVFLAAADPKNRGFTRV